MPKALVIVFAAMSLAVAACGGSDEPAGPRPLAVGYSFGMDVGDVGDALAFELLEEDGEVDVRVRDMGGASEAVVGLRRGDIRLAQVPYRQLLDAITAGAPVRAVLGQSMASELVLVGGPGIDGVADLRGKKIGTSVTGGSGEVLVQTVLEQGGLTTDDAELVFIDESTTRAPALAAGRLDASILDYVDFELLKRRDASEYTLLERAKDVLPPIPTVVWAVDESWAKENDRLLRDVVARLLDGYEDVYSSDGRDAWVAEAQRSFLGGKDADAAPGLYSFYRGVRLWPERSTGVTEEQHDRAVEAWVAHEDIEQAVSFDDSWLPDYWSGATD